MAQAPSHKPAGPSEPGVAGTTPAGPGPDLPPSPGRAASGGPSARRWLALVLIMTLAGLIFFSLHRYINADAVFSRYDDLRAFVSGSRLLALAAYVLAYIATVCLSVPGSIMMTAMGGLLFGWMLGGLAATLAAGTGAVLVFLMARTALGPLLARDAGPRMARIAQGLQEDAVSFLLFLRLTPLVPFFVVNVAAALFGVRLRTFALCTFLGIMPAALAYAAAGSALDGVIVAQRGAVEACRASGQAGCGFEFTFRTLLTPGLIAALAGLGLLALMPVLLRRTGILGRRSREI
jgi:uncharacterized membrane protein YdjX (TVP38/TMEM64 family)